MSKKKSDFRVIQVIFKTEKEYKEFHADAVKFHGTDNRLADTAYVREDGVYVVPITCLKN